MAERKSPNKLMIIVAAAVVVLFIVVMFSKRGPRYSEINSLPTFNEDSQPQDGDTQADTIRALQAYAKEAVNKAEVLNEKTREHQTTVLENRNNVSKLQNANKALTEATEKMTAYTRSLEAKLKSLEHQLEEVKEDQERNLGAHGEEGIPVGFGFDHLQQKHDSETGEWHDPLDRTLDESEEKGRGFTGLLKPPGKTGKTQNQTAGQKNKKAEIKLDDPVFTLAKDSVLYDGIAMTALIGRIPVEGTTPDPYPVKIFIGKENLAANGHELPEVEGMIFSGLGIGDWNLSCVSARLYSATYIFEDGSVVNHTSDAKPLGYISDRKGWPCVSGIFKTNAPKFLRNRIGLAGLGAAGSAYAEAQYSQHRSNLTGETTRELSGSIEKLVGGTLVQTATDEASQWLLERQKQSFDAVIVEPGADVSIHLEKALAIDRSDLNRKLRYSYSMQRTPRTLD